MVLKSFGRKKRERQSLKVLLKKKDYISVLSTKSLEKLEKFRFMDARDAVAANFGTLLKNQIKSWRVRFIVGTYKVSPTMYKS